MNIIMLAGAGRVEGSTGRGDRQVEFKLGRQFILRIHSVCKIYSSQSTVGVDSDPNRFHIITAIGSLSKVGQVKADLIPPLVQTKGHRTDEMLHSRHRLKVRGPEATSDAFVVKNFHFKAEIFF